MRDTALRRTLRMKFAGLTAQGRTCCKLHRHFTMPHRGAGGEAFGRVDDGVGVDAVVAIQLVDGAGLAETLHTKGFEPVAAYAANPTERRRMAIDHGDDAAVAR